MLNVFISGLAPQTGKTIVTAGLAATMQSLSYSTCVYKPIQTKAEMLNGFKVSPDLALIKRVDSNISTGSTYMMKSSAPPFVSAYEEGFKIDAGAILTEFQGFSQMTDCNIVEGSNSISTPVAQYLTEIDIVKTLRMPLILVVNPKRTPIDLVISGLNFIQNSRVNFSGIIINQHNEKSENLEEKYFPQIIKEYTDAKILGMLPDYEKISLITPETLIADILTNIDIESIFGLEIAKLQRG